MNNLDQIRDSYIRINWGNIVTGNKNSFEGKKGLLFHWLS